MNKYEEKQETRRERYKERAQRARDESENRHQAARGAVSGIPFGQPILVGHHSERRHRAALRRSDTNMRKAIEAHEKAEYYEAKAAGVGKGGISSDDPDAIPKLRAKLEKLEKDQGWMKAMNVIIRKGGTPDQIVARMLEKSQKLNVRFDNKEAYKLLVPDFMGRVGFPPYTLQGNNANIRRIKARIQELESRPQIESVEVHEYDGFRILHHGELNRVQIVFPGKPDPETRQLLKSHGFRWSRSEGAWQRHLNNQGIAAAEYVAKQLAES